MLGLLFAGAVEASSQDVANRIAFEVATIRPSASDSHGSNLNFDVGRVRARNITLQFLLQEAFHLNSGSDDQISGGPSWLRSAAFDIDAKEDDVLSARLEKLPPDERSELLRQLLQALLVDRFGLKFHYEMRVAPIIALTVAKRGSKLEPAEKLPKSGAAAAPRWGGLHNNGNGEVEGRGATMDMLVNVLASQAEIGGRVAVNQTGMTGKYDFTLRWTPEVGEPLGGAYATPEGPSLFAAVQEQLGLKLESRKAPLRVLVIDSVAKASEN